MKITVEIKREPSFNSDTLYEAEWTFETPVHEGSKEEGKKLVLSRVEEVLDRIIL